MSYHSAQSAAFKLCQKTRLSSGVIQIEKPAAALERYRADYSRSMAAAKAAAANVRSFSRSIAAVREAISGFAIWSPAWKAAKKRADKAMRKMQSDHATSTSANQSDLDGTRDRERQAAYAQWADASKALAEMEAIYAAGTASGSTLHILYQGLEAAKAAEAKHRADAVSAAAAIKVFDDLRLASAAAEQKRLDEIARLPAQADKKAAHDALRREKIIVLARKLSVGADVAEEVLKHLQNRHFVRAVFVSANRARRRLAAKKARQSLPALEAINRFATENGIGFKDAEEMLSS